MNTKCDIASQTQSRKTYRTIPVKPNLTSINYTISATNSPTVNIYQISQSKEIRNEQTVNNRQKCPVNARVNGLCTQKGRQKKINPPTKINANFITNLESSFAFFQGLENSTLLEKSGFYRK